MNVPQRYYTEDHCYWKKVSPPFTTWAGIKLGRNLCNLRFFRNVQIYNRTENFFYSSILSKLCLYWSHHKQNYQKECFLEWTFIFKCLFFKTYYQETQKKLKKWNFTSIRCHLLAIWHILWKFLPTIPGSYRKG